jgi:hypothetical protein
VISLTIKEKIKTILKLLNEPKVLYSLVSFRSFGYLLETGWFESFKSGEPLDADLKPTPWFTYSAIDFLKERLNHGLSLLEFGSGNSTLFFAERTKKIISLEHNKDWHQKISSKLPENVELINTSSATDKDYLQPLVENSIKFDVIIIDGIYRNECIMNSINHLSERGVIILDDSERDVYAKGIKHLLDRGFKQINFSGIAPGIFFRKCTSIFYKNKNCLNI